jgi:hypothetical protein
MRIFIRMTTAGWFALAMLAVSPGARAGDLIGLRDDDLRYEFFEPYLERIDTVTTSAGNAVDINAVTHMIDPWPRHVRNRRVPANGERMVGAVERYRRGRLQLAPPPIAPIYTTSGVASQAQRIEQGQFGDMSGSVSTTITPRPSQ